MRTYRHLSNADLPAYSALCRYCFQLPAEYTPHYLNWVKRYRDYSWAAFDGRELLAGMWYYPFSMQVGDRFLPMGGVIGVATVPEVREGGLAREMMVRAHRQMRREGCALAVLRPFKYDFYSRMGYGDTFHFLDATFAPQQVATRSHRGHRLRAVNGHGEWRLFEQLRHQYGPRRFGTVRRDKAYWDFRIFFSQRGTRHCYLVEKRRQPTGFVVTEMGPSWDSNEIRLFVVDAVWKEQGALDAIMQLLRRHRDQVKKVCWFLPVDMRLHDQMVDPLIDVRLKSKMMLKLVDIRRAIEERAYPPDFAGELTLDVTEDETSPWNTGRWSVRWHGGQARVTSVRGRRSRGGLVHCDAGTLAILYSGRLTASELSAADRLAADQRSVELLDRAFPAGTPYIGEWF